MHRTLKQETASPPAANRRRQQERFDRFRKEYNEERPIRRLARKHPPAFMNRRLDLIRNGFEKPSARTVGWSAASRREVR